MKKLKQSKEISSVVESRDSFLGKKRDKFAPEIPTTKRRTEIDIVQLFVDCDEFCQGTLPELNVVEEVFWQNSRRYGSRRITAELRDQTVVGWHRVRRLMREQGLQAIQSRRFVPRTTDSRHGRRTSPNLLVERAITVDRPRQMWTRSFAGCSINKATRVDPILALHNE